jgi:pectate lyase
VHANVKEEKSYCDKVSTTLKDPYWSEKATIAAKKNDEAYTPDPYEVSENLTSSVSD